MNYKINIPTSWNEVSNSQFKKLAMLLYSNKKDIYFDVACLKILMNIKWYQFYKLIKFYFILTQVPMSELKKNFEFIYKANDRTIFPKKINGYYAPLNKIINLTAEEFSVADDLHIKWRETHNKEFLIYLVATLYSKTKQPREVFDKNCLPDKIKEFQNIPIAVLLCVELTYFGCKNNLVKRYPTAFPKSIKKAPNKKYGFGKVILQMAGRKFGNHEQTKATNIYTFLEEFNQNLQDASKNT